MRKFLLIFYIFKFQEDLVVVVVGAVAEGEHPEEVAEAEEVMIINKFFLSMTSLKCFITSLQS